MPVRTDPAGRPRLPHHLRVVFDPARGRHVLLGPESVAVLNDTAAATLHLCDGSRTVTEIVEELRGRYDGVAETQVRDFLDRLMGARRLETGDG